MNALVTVVCATGAIERLVGRPQPDGTERLKELARSATAAGDLASRLARELVDTPALGDLAERPLSLERSIEIALVAVRPQLPARTQVTRRYEGDVEVFGREIELLRVLTNLLVNAARAIGAASPERGEISVSYVRFGDSAIVTITDNGMPLSPDDEESATSIRGRGLAVCREVLGRMGGELRIHARFPGTVIAMVLPLGAKGR